MAGAFQPNAFQNNAFQVDPAVLTANISEGLRLSEVQFVGTGVSTGLSDAIKLVEIFIVVLNPLLADLTEGIKAADGAFVARINPENVSQTEQLRIVDAVAAAVGAPGAFPTEVLRISDAPSVQINPEQATPVENVRLVEQLAVIRTNPLAGAPPPPPVMSTELVLTIGGVEAFFHTGTLDIQERIGARNTLGCTVFSLSGSFRPAVESEIIITRLGTRIFGGLINDFDETLITKEPGGLGLEYAISAVDFNALADRRSIIVSFPAQTLKASLQTLVADYLDDYGVTLHGSQVDGPVLPAQAFVFQSITEILNQLCQVASTLTGPPQAVTWAIDYDKVLRAWGVLDSAHAAPFDIVATDANVYGDFKVKPSRTDYANSVILLFGTGQKTVIDNVGTGNGILTQFFLHYPLATHEGYVNVGGSVVGGAIVGGVNETLGLSGSGATWIYNTGDFSITRTSAPTGVILIPFTANFPVHVQVSASVGGPSERIERVYTQPDVFDFDVATSIANALLQQVSVDYKEVQYLTPTPGLHPGMIQTITDAKHAISGLHLLTSVRITDRAENVLWYEVAGIAGTGTVPESWMATYQLWAQSGSGGGSAGAVAVVTTTIVKQPYFLGGNSVVMVQHPTPDWTPADAVRVTIDTAVRGSLAGVVRARLRATAGTVTARLRNITDNTTAGTSTAVSGSAWTDESFAVSLAAGAKVYELQLLPSIADVDVAAVGYFE